MITETTTLAELRQMPLAEAVTALFPGMALSDLIAAICPRAEQVAGHRYGPMGSIFFRPMLFEEVGSFVQGHEHNFDHDTLITQGAVLVEFTLPNGKSEKRRYDAPAVILIKKSVIHKITSLAPNTWAVCLYATRDADTGEVVFEWDGGLRAYQ